MRPPRRPDAVFEITVVGGLGPTLRARFLPVATTACALNTVVCLQARDGEDLVDVLGLFVRDGLEVSTVGAIH